MHHSNPLHRNQVPDDDSDTEQVPIISLNGGINTPTPPPGLETTSFVFLSNNHEHNHNNIRTVDGRIKAVVEEPTELMVDPDFKPDYSKD